MSEDSISLHPHVQAVVRGGTFLEAVRAHCILLKANNTNLSDEDIQLVALTHAYPRIGLILATTKDKDGNPILGGMGAAQDYRSQYQEVIRLITSPPYRDDIHRIAAQLTASHLIKQLPLNTTLQFYTLGVQLEEQAIKDLERLCGNVQPTKASEYYRLAIYLHSPQDLIQVPQNTFAYCWYYITAMNQGANISSRDGLIELPIGDLNTAIYKLVYELNEAFIDAGANLVISSNQISVSTDTPEGSKKVYSLTIASRVSSPKVSREMITLRFLTCNQTTLANYQQDLVFDYIGDLQYGISPENLTARGPHSLLVDVREGQVASGSSTQSSLKEQGKSVVVDTFYFNGEDLSGPFIYRVSTADLLTNTPYRTIQARGSANQLALDLLQDLQASRWQNLVLGSLPFPNAVRVVLANPVESRQLKVIIDILTLPNNLEVALGDDLFRATTFERGPRSVTIEAITFASQQANQQSLTAGGYIFGSTQVLNKKLSPRLQSVYDKLNQLDKSNKFRGRPLQGDYWGGSIW